MSKESAVKSKNKQTFWVYMLSWLSFKAYNLQVKSTRRSLRLASTGLNGCQRLKFPKQIYQTAQKPQGISLTLPPPGLLVGDLGIAIDLHLPLLLGGGTT